MLRLNFLKSSRCATAFTSMLCVFCCCCGIISDVNECLEENPCSSYAECVNFQGSVKCKCFEGYQGDGISCEGFNIFLKMILYPV